jgi:hypothetical protein
MNNNEKQAVNAVGYIFETFKTAPYLFKSYSSTAKSGLDELVSYECNADFPPMPESVPLDKFSQWSDEYEMRLKHNQNQLDALIAIMPASIAEHNSSREQVHSHIETIVNNPEGFEGIDVYLLLNMRQAAGFIRKMESEGYKGTHQSLYWRIKPQIKLKVDMENPEAAALLEQAVLFYAADYGNIVT